MDEDAADRQANGPSHSPVINCHLSRKHLKKTLKRSNNSAPGPDGLPYGAWRALGDIAIDALFGAFKELSSSDGPSIMQRDYADFNASILLFLPKKPVRQSDEGTVVFEAKGVRPLNVTNSDNRLIASAVRMVLEPVIGLLITTYS